MRNDEVLVKSHLRGLGQEALPWEVFFFLKLDVNANYLKEIDTHHN